MSRIVGRICESFMGLAYTTSDLHVHCTNVHNSPYSWLDARTGRHTLNRLFDDQQVILYIKIHCIVLDCYWLSSQDQRWFTVFYDKILSHCVQKAFEHLVEITLTTFCQTANGRKVILKSEDSHPKIRILFTQKKHHRTAKHY